MPTRDPTSARHAFKPTFHIAVAVVHRDGRWLVAQRPADVHLAGLWEFPGGKCEAGETPADAALRELREECGIQATVERHLDVLTADYGDRIVHLAPVVCRWEAGEALALASEACCWVGGAELRALPMPAINARILAEILGDAR